MIRSRGGSRRQQVKPPSVPVEWFLFVRWYLAPRVLFVPGRQIFESLTQANCGKGTPAHSSIYVRMSGL